MRRVVEKDKEVASPRISIGAGAEDSFESFFVGDVDSVSCVMETKVSSVLIPTPVWRENVPGVSGVGMIIKDS